MGFLREVIAGFVGAGLALALLRVLGERLLGHWLAKTLVRYTAKVETGQIGTRVAIERLDGQRAKFIDSLTANLAQCELKIADAVELKGTRSDGPEFAFLEHYREIVEAINRIAIDSAGAAHLFEPKERLIQLVFAWAAYSRSKLDGYWDGITALADQEAHWHLERSERLQVLEKIRYEHLFRKPSFPAFQDLISCCRAFTRGSAG